MSEQDNSSGYEAVDVFERLFDRKCRELPSLVLRNIPQILDLHFLLRGPRTWFPFSRAIKSNLRYDQRIDFPVKLDLVTVMVVLRDTYDVAGEIPPSGHTNHLLEPGEQISDQAARAMICYWNGIGQLEHDYVEVLAIKGSQGNPKGIIYYHKGLKLPEKAKSGVLDLLPSPF